MAGKTRELRTRMKAVGNIQRITKTMQMIATAQFQAVQRRATSAQAYANKLSDVVGQLTEAVGQSGDVDHPLLSGPDTPVKKDLILVLTSNRGLCGGYNGNVIRPAMSFLKDRSAAEAQLEVVGKKGMGIFKFSRREVAAFHSHIGDTPAFEDVNALAERFIAEFSSGQYDGIYVVSTRFITMGKQVPELTRLLPMEAPGQADDDDQAAADTQGEAAAASTAADGGPGVVYEFSPSAEALLGELLPATIKTKLFQLFNEAAVSEQLARMVAMKAATDAAGKMRKSLSRDYNRARQAAITTELTEIIGGTAALE